MAGTLPKIPEGLTEREQLRARLRQRELAARACSEPDRSDRAAWCNLHGRLGLEVARLEALIASEPDGEETIREVREEAREDLARALAEPRTVTREELDRRAAQIKIGAVVVLGVVSIVAAAKWL